MSVSFFEVKHATLKHDYSDGSGIYADSCGLVAVEMAELLQAEGKEPRILTIRGEQLDSVGNRATLVPTAFEGRVRWGAHIICEAEGQVYDPMMDSVLPIEDYLSRAFSQPVELDDRSHILTR